MPGSDSTIWLIMLPDNRLRDTSTGVYRWILLPSNTFSPSHVPIHSTPLYEGDAAPEKCPLCKAPASKFVEVEEAQAGGPLVFADEHVIGVAKGCDDEMIKDLNNHFMGECTEVGMYLAMSRQADREGYPEVAEAFKRYAWEEAEHAAKFAELLGDCVWDTKTNLEKRMNAESGACEDKKRIATRAKALNLDAIHDTVHEMAKDEARHGKGFEGL